MPRKKFRILIDGEVYEVEAEVVSDASFKDLLTSLSQSTIKKVEEGAGASLNARNMILSPITGRVVEVKVRPGQRVDANTVIAVLESMKTQFEVKAGRSGVISRVLVDKGRVVKEGEAIAAFEEGRG